jgi:hypothetical protein
MANLIITVIAIALVAVASLMGAYYGGSAFLNNTQAANASTVMNIGQQVAGAWTAYLVDHNNSPPAARTDLTNNNYLASIPTIPAMPGPVTVAASSGPYIETDQDGSVWLFTNVGTVGGANPPDPYAGVCLKIIKTATGQTLAIPPSENYSQANLETSSSFGNGVFGCFSYNQYLGNFVSSFGNNNSVGNNSSYTFFYRIH